MANINFVARNGLAVGPTAQQIIEASGNITGTSLTLTTQLPVVQGGTGATSLSAGLVKANGTSAFTTATAGTDYPGLSFANTWSAAQSFTALSASGVITSTLATGTAPFTVASTTPVANLSIGGNAATASNVSAGTAGAIVYQSGANASTFLSLGTTNYVLTAGTSAPQYVAQSSLTVGNATNATNISGGSIGNMLYQSGTGATSFVANGTAGQAMISTGNAAPTWAGVGRLFAGTFSAGGATTEATGWLSVPAGASIVALTTGQYGFRFNTGTNKFEGFNGTTWGTIGGGGATGGGNDDAFYENTQIITTNYSITSGKNAMTTGPITVNAGVTITIPVGANWVIL